MKRVCLLLTALCVALGWSASAAMAGGAELIGGPGDGPTTTLPEYVYDPANPEVHVDDGSGNPLDVYLDGEAGAIIKIFQPAVPLPHTLHIIEQWHVAGLGISDWHEEIVSPGLVWSSVLVTTSSGTGATVTGDGTSVLDIVFDERLPFCTNFTIDKYIQMPGDGQAVIVHEWPTPEPATMTLLGLGLAGLVARKRKR